MVTPCECGKPAAADLSIWNGMYHMPVCDLCWNQPENIVLEACVTFAENTNGQSLEDCFRDELGFRQIPWTRELQALCDRLYCEWYVAVGVVSMMDDSDRNILWELRFEPCDQTDTCPSNYHTDSCPLSEEEER